MRILLSNDDGYFAPGLIALAEALAPLAELTVVAPERDRSGASNSLTLDRPLTISQAPNGFFHVNGTPTDCVTIAINKILHRKPDLLVSGINPGANRIRMALVADTAECVEAARRISQFVQSRV